MKTNATSSNDTPMDEKNTENYDEEYIKTNDQKREIEVEDRDKNEERYDDGYQKMGNAPWITKTKNRSRGNENIINAGNECVQINDTKKDIVIVNVVSDDHEYDTDKDEELYNDENHEIAKVTETITTKGQDNDLEGVSKNCESANNGEARQQHNGELQANENVFNEGKESSLKNIVKNKADITRTIKDATIIATIDQENSTVFI